MLQPKVGDKVLVEMVVTYIYSDGYITFNGGCPSDNIKKVIPPEPKVGDTVWWDKAPYDGSTLLYIHQEPGDYRKWGVVAFKGDIPYSVVFDQLRTTR